MSARKLFLSVTVLAFLVVAMSFPARAEEIMVSAAASLTDVMREIGEIYESKSHNKVSFNFGASSKLARQIDEGAPVDLFFSADLDKMEYLDKRGWIEGASRKNVLSNSLVMVVPEESKLGIESVGDLIRGDVRRIAVAEPSSVPVGIYTQQYLERDGLWVRIKSKVIPVADARAALAAIESGNVDVGFVYRTDAAISPKVEVVYEVPRNKGPRIIYPLGLVKESTKKQMGRKFLNFLLSGKAKEIFRKYGFIVLQ
ncbi:MAG: molybdate ABC transporter substrate-binding protein [Candidatus Binatia bacterium]